MQIALSSVLARSGPPPSASDAAAADGNAFAHLLQQQAPAARDAQARTDRTTEDSDERDRDGDTPDERRTQRQRAAHRAPSRPADRPASSEAEARAVPADAKTPTDEGLPPDPAGHGLHDWLAALHLPAPLPDAAAGPSVAGSDTLLPGPPAAGADVTAMADPGGSDPEAMPAAGVGALRPAPRDSLAAAARAAGPALETPVVESGDAARAGDVAEVRPVKFDLPATPRQPSAIDVTPAAAATGPAPTTQAATPAAVALATPLSDPQFARAFGVQVSVLARDGVQRAELHLNPAEMGPVSVQIVMDGTLARIDFGADAAGTRDLIEDSLPDLAAALREAGLTLSGGGVSQHSAGRDRASGAAPAPRDGDADAAAAAAADAAPLRRHVRAGGLDLYA